MIDPDRLALFVGAALALLLTPGPAVLYIVNSSLEQGTRAGVASALGLALGGGVHMLAALVGLTALLAATSAALALLRWAGAAYLVYLAWKEVSAPPWTPETRERPLRRNRELFRGGVLVNLLNPKSALFFFAFLPQFVDPARGDPRIQLLLLSACFFLLALTTDTMYAFLGGRGGRLLRVPAVHTARRWISAGIYAGLGLAAVLEGGLG